MIENSDLLLLALARCESELPNLVGDPWPEFQQRLQALVQLLENGDPSAYRAILELLSESPAAYGKIFDTIDSFNLRTLKFWKDDQASSADTPKDAFIRVPVLYATNRGRSADFSKDPYFTGSRGEMGYGTAEVSIPHHHRIGEIERPAWWRLEFRENPSDHIVILNVVACSHTDFLGQIGKSFSSQLENEALVFVHGYNVSFPDALRRSAQMAVDLRFSGPTVLFSWPSQGKTEQYMVDETNAEWAVSDLEHLLLDLMARTSVQSLNVIAHSMGGRLLSQALERISKRPAPEKGARLRQIIFAAPDIDSETFKKAAFHFRQRGDRCTLYASSNDEALAASKMMHGFARAGDASGDIVVMEGLDTLDASAMDTSLLGHSYYGSKRSILSDIHDLLRYGHEPSGRFGLISRQHPAGAYWIFQS